MDAQDLMTYYKRFKYREDIAHELIRNRVDDILLVSTFYDAFIFEQDGMLSEQLFGEYQALNLSSPPRVTSVPTGEAALHALESHRYGMVVTTLRIGGMSADDFARQVKERHGPIPVVLLVNNHADLGRVEAGRQRFSHIDDVFLWTGDSKVLLAMVKSVEDRLNVERDTAVGLVRVILLIEDSAAYYSAFLPILYQVIVHQTQVLISGEVTPASRQLRTRMRPKILLAHDTESAERAYLKYKDYLICILSDVAFPRNGRMDEEAGVRFMSRVRQDGCMVPVLIQSHDPENRFRAAALGARFLHKGSPHVLSELRDFVVSDLGFGDFVFRRPDGTEIVRASTSTEFASVLRWIPDESLLYHTRHNQYSAWLMAHGEVAVAKEIRPIQAGSFLNTRDLRQFLIGVFDEVERSRKRGRLVECAAGETMNRESVVRLREGSLGGKGRGLAFLNALLYALDYRKRYPGIDVSLPATAIIGTHEFDEFLERNRIGKDVVNRSDAEIRRIFMNGVLSDDLKERLEHCLASARFPIAVRSSGLLEDSMTCPFAGIYRTILLSNQGPDRYIRLRDIHNAIKLVFASVFERLSREYIAGTRFTLEEEKMAVVLQEVVGSPHDVWYYPDVSGVAQSRNFYPAAPMNAEDGIATVALGLGKAVMEGERVHRFCPAYPAMGLESEDLFGCSQKELWAIRMDAEVDDQMWEEEGTLGRITLRDAERHGTLAAVGSVWDVDNDRVVDDLSLPGPRLVTFANILKHDQFPLAALVRDFLEIGEKALGMPVEMEFAAQVRRYGDAAPGFFPLQIRPLAAETEEVEVPTLHPGVRDQTIIYSAEALGNGVIEGIHDLVVVDRHRFKPTETPAIRDEVAELNRMFRTRGERYVLIGPGRWGSRDRFLGIPVSWPDIAEAIAIVETDLENFRIDASQGSHFFHNIVSLNVGYFKVRFASDTGFVDWDWIDAQEVVCRTAHCLHVRTAVPCTLRMDGSQSRAVLLRG